MLPPDPEAHGFDNIAEAQEVSYVQLSRYLEAAEVAIDGAMRLSPEPKPSVLRTWFSEKGRYLGKDEFEGQGTGRNRPVGKWLVILRQPNSAQAPFRIEKKSASHHEEGWYRFRVRCRAVLYENGKLLPPERGHVASINTAAKRLLGRFDVPEGPDGGVVEFKAWQGKGELLEFFCDTLDDRNFDRKNPKSPYRGDGIAVERFEIEGPFANAACVEDDWPPQSYLQLFGDLPMKPWAETSSLRPPEALNLPDLTANKRGLRETYQVPPGMTMVASEDPQSDAERLLRDFMARAYRGKPEETEVQRCLTFATRAIQQRSCFQDAMRLAYKAALCSPDFLFFREEPGELDSHALANRLSYLLWRSMPDSTLREAAEAGELQTNEGLEREFARLLSDSRAERFVKDFTGQWLELLSVHETSPDRYLFPEYFCDNHLVDSGVSETEATFATMIQDNLPAQSVVDTNFVMVNERLAKLYGIEGVRGRAIRRIALPESSPRGGFLTQSSVLKVTANGLATSPVIRGAWVLERILGTPAAAPPPDAGAIEPHTQGAATIRELLAKHSRSESCAGCHAEIDPPGFALESFDVMGAWREHYRSFGEGENLKLKLANRQVRFKRGFAVDSSGVTKDGKAFADVFQYRNHLLQQERQIARNLTERFLTFATGAGISFADRREVEAILSATEDDSYPVRDLLQRVVLSKTFRSK